METLAVPEPDLISLLSGRHSSIVASGVHQLAVMQITRFAQHHGVVRCRASRANTGASASAAGRRRRSDATNLSRPSSSSSPPSCYTAHDSDDPATSPVAASRDISPAAWDSSLPSVTVTGRRMLLLLLATPSLALALSPPGRGSAEAAKASIAATSTIAEAAAVAASPGRVQFVNSAQGYQLEVPSEWEKVDKVRRRASGEIDPCVHGPTFKPCMHA